MFWKSKTKVKARQLELPIERPIQPDRNFAQGGRSFYFFDFDDNVVYLPTPLYLYDKNSGAEKPVSTREYSIIAPELGKPGPWLHYEVRLDPRTGSFRRFRHHDFSFWQKSFGKKQPIVEDLLEAVRRQTEDWKGPSWNFFWHAVHNRRPLSIITARGHRPETIREAISHLVSNRHISCEPNYLSLFPVSNLDVRQQLGDAAAIMPTAQLKQLAIHSSVEQAFKTYGYNPAHRFGMSDDDPVNLRLIIEAMMQLKKKYRENSFFVIDTHAGRLIKQEVFEDCVKQSDASVQQLDLFEE